MVQPTSSTKKNALHELGYKIFLDRYALKDMKRETLAVGDTVIVVVDSKTGQREIGTVTALALPKVTIQLRDGETVTRDLEHVDKPLETDPVQMMDRVAAGIASVEATPEKQREWTENFRWLLDDWKFVPGGRILTGAGTEQELTYYNCMPPDQEILTADGYKPIAEVHVGDYVVTHQNRLRRVLHRFERETEEPLFVITPKKVGYDALRLTGEHKVLAIRQAWVNTHRSRDGLRLSQAPAWIPAQDLQPGDFVALVWKQSHVEYASGMMTVTHTAHDSRFLRPVGAVRFANVEAQYQPLDWVRIDSITTEAYRGTVLDLEVEEDHSFVSAGVVVSNCYVIPSPKDSRGGIMDTLTQMTEIMSRGGGVGINISSLRPRHAYVKGVNGRSSGSVSWGALYSFVTGLIEQGGCFSPNSRILTDKGYIPAQELAERIENGEVFHAQTHMGKRRITARFRNGVKPLYRVETTRGYRVDVTADHKIAVLMDGKITTMPLKYLQEGDEILLMLGEGVGGDAPSLEAPAYERSVMSTTLNTDITLPAVLDEDLAYFVGYMYGDGYVHMGKKVTWQEEKAIKLATADTYPTIRQHLMSAIERLFGITPHLENGDGACKNVVIYSRVVVDWLRHNGLLKAKAEAIRVPEAIFRAPSHVVGAFIAGYFDADGSDRKKKGGYGFDSISRDMLGDVQKLLSANGIISRISAQDRSAQGWQTLYRLTITGAQFRQRFADFVPAEKVGGGTQKRDMSNTYPASVWEGLGVRSEFRQRIYDGVSERISYNQMTAIRDRLARAEASQAVTDVDALLRMMPDRITSINPLAESETFDFEVDDVHLLSSDGVYTSNSRRGALMLILNDWHPDVFNFINSKREMGQITNANISVGVSDRLMEAVKADGDWELVFPDTSEEGYDDEWDGDLEGWIARGRKVIRYKTIKARELWNAIVESAWASAEPGVWFRERSNKMSNSWYYNPLIATNPCGEQPLSKWSVCNLGALNLARFYDEAAGDVAWADLDRAVRYAVRFLDDVIDGTPYFFEENKATQQSERRVGLGTMGVAELMIYCGVRYGSPESVAFIDKLYKAIAVAAYETSAEIAHEKGSFAHFDAEKVLQSGYMMQMPDHVRQMVREKGLRNVTLLTQAPTGTTGTMVNTSTGIEPFFSWVYYRKSRLGLHEEQVPIVADWYAKNPNATALPDFFITAMELAPEEHVRVQGAFQKWVDSAISKTANVPNQYTVEQVSDLYLLMYELGCKGGTIYRDGSRNEQVLMLKGDERAESEMEGLKKKDKAEERAEVHNTPHKVYPRPVLLQGTTVSFKTPFGTAYITMNNDEHSNPFEVFITVGKAGSDVQADAEAMGRMISLQLRTTAPHNRREMLRLIMEQLEGIGGARATGFGQNRVLSLPDAVASALKQYYFKEEQPQQLGLPMTLADAKPAPAPAKPSNSNGVTVESSYNKGADMCPECGTISFIRAEGCKKCTTCGYSEC